MTHATRREAKDCGAIRYFTGTPCLHGHVAERLVSNAQCIDCGLVKKAKWNKDNREKATSTSRAWRAENRDRVNTLKAAWSAQNPEGQKDRSRRWYLANKEKANASTARWREANRDISAAAAARRRARVLNQTPAWADHGKILWFYSEARRITAETGIEHHVDHIIPLAGKLVRGLHCEGNLQVLPAQLNRSKSNHFSE